MTIRSRIRLELFLCTSIVLPIQTTGTPTQTEDGKALEERVGHISLKDEYFASGLARLNMQTHDLGFAIEFLAGKPGLPPPPDSKLTSEFLGGTVQGALDWLCQLDPRYSWRLNGRTVNVFPKTSDADPGYFFNRIISKLIFTNLINANDSLDIIFKPVSRGSEAVISFSENGSFAKPWNATFQNVTVRQALDRVAENLGSGHGWMVSGNDQVRIISFYLRLQPASDSPARGRLSGLVKH